MKGKKSNMEVVKSMIRKIHEDSELMKVARRFVDHLGNKA